MDESTDFFLLGLATTCALSELFSAITPPPDPIALSRLGVFRAHRVNFFSATTPSPGRLPKSQYFSEFHLGNHVSDTVNNYTFNISTNNNLSLSEYTFFTSHRILMQQCHDNLIKYGISYPCLRSRGFNFFII